MTGILSDLSTSTFLPFGVIAARLVLAAICGAVVGFEREWQRHSAGLRTHMLVSLAAACFAVLGIEIVHSPQFDSDASRLDPIRLIEAVTAGVAFLAAGTIIFARGRIKGLTTGAGLWLGGAIGLACGLGFWPIAILATVLALVVLGLIHEVEKRLVSRDRSRRGDDDA